MTDPQTFAQKWIDDWNSHNLHAILEHYAETLEFHSPKVAIYSEGKRSHFTTRAELRPYFARALTNRPNLHFELIHVTSDAKGVAIVYKNDVNVIGVEVMNLDPHGRVIKARVLYSAAK